MYLLRRAAVRATTATPSRLIFAKPRSISTFTPIAFRSRPQACIVPSFQRRFASDEPTKIENAEKAAAEAENFAQTAPEAPVEENLTPAQVSAQAEPTDASATVGTDALEAAAAKKSIETDRRRSRGAPAEPGKTVYVGNLFYEVTEDQLRRVFARFGSVENVKIIYDPKGLSRGFAYVDFAEVNDAQVAVDSLDMQVFEGRNLVVQFHRPRVGARNRNPLKSNDEGQPSNTLFIGNMSFEMSDKDLNDLFRDIRNVVDIRVSIDRRTGQPRGFAHAEFIDVASATQAVSVLKGKQIYGRELRVNYSNSTRSRKENSNAQNEGE